MKEKKYILVTGAAGFIGFHLCKKLLKNNQVIGYDNLNSYYDISLKQERLRTLKKENLNKDNWLFFDEDLCNFNALEKIFEDFKPEIVIHLAAQAGVRYSIDNPLTYVNSNLVGFSHILECCRKYLIKNLIYASSSSVYGGNEKMPFSEKDNVDHPKSLYAATKKSNELMAHSYSHLFNIPCTGLRFFTVYGPWGRPDMAPMIFAKSIFKNEPINLFNDGNMSRDFTYIDDVIEIIIRIMNKPAKPDQNFNKSLPNPSTSWAPHRIFNIGNNKNISLIKFINTLEEVIGIKAIKNYLPIHKSDVKDTLANTDEINDWIQYKPSTELKHGIEKFISWYREYHNIKNKL